MVKYSREPDNPTKSCKARGDGLRVHFKNTRETAFSLRKLPLAKAKRYLEDVLAHKQAIPFRRFCGGVGRTAQAKNRHSNGQGRWPAKSARFILDLLKNAESNAEVKGLDVDALYISHIQVNQAQKQRRRTYRAHGRINRTPCHIELVLSEKEEPVKKEIPVLDLKGKLVGLHFSVHSHRMCRKLIPKLVEFYNEEDDFKQSFETMPWLALPFKDKSCGKLAYLSFTLEKIDELAEIDKAKLEAWTLETVLVNGENDYVIDKRCSRLGPSGRTTAKKARMHLTGYGGDAFPFTEEHPKQLEEKIEEQAKGWPEKVKYELHAEHELIRTIHSTHICDGCRDIGSGWSSDANDVDLIFTPSCALKESENTGTKRDSKDGSALEMCAAKLKLVVWDDRISPTCPTSNKESFVKGGADYKVCLKAILISIFALGAMTQLVRPLRISGRAPLGMDWQGQKLVELWMQVLLLVFAVVAFVTGYITASFRTMMLIYAGGVVFTSLVTVPNWPFFNRHPLKWLDPSEAEKHPKPQQQAVASKDKKKSSKK
ncbi:hypothetical protein SADUNF_Sadunf08G0144800 [Salix dunnii]|uniref:60S ribosomal protein L17 n=1 Tax=Salix dunnii TaxID=1413687 RepID=A0A835MY75_9ROSI|nr:hypothetical protein SADUNF_Sadunf08G0144800 [Salix dunnii]